MPEPHLRAADADRAAVATVLGRHMSAGQLTMDEYDERLARAYAAKTYGELDEITADLPAADLAPLLRFDRFNLRPARVAYIFDVEHLADDWARDDAGFCSTL